jgi:lysophospholipase L1-like esterase
MALVGIQLAIILLIGRNWAYVTTYRLYLDRRTDANERSAAAQSFDIEGRQVVPRIVTRGPDRIAFRTDIRQDSTIHALLRARHPVRYAIEWRDGSAHRVLVSGTVSGTASIASPFPTGTGTVEFVSDDSLEWIDPRVVRNYQVGRHLIALGMLFFASCMLTRRRSDDDSTWSRPATRVAAFKFVTTMVSVLLALLGLEMALRAMGDAAPAGILSARHDLGEVTPDLRWEESPRYGRRLRPNVDVLNEWRYGDIVRMGFIPPTVADGALHQFRFRTDAEGFRNSATRERFDVAALGDSFTDATTMAVEASWPMQLERRLGITVQNYGTAGFGPQQELLVLKDVVAAHRPRVVVLAFFAGNDIFDSEAFDTFQRFGGAAQRSAPGWRIKEVVSRADTWYVTAALGASFRWMHSPSRTEVLAEAPPTTRSPAAGDGRASFDRGMFAVPINGRLLRWAFMPPYLNTLNFSEGELAARSGWALTREALQEMQRVSQSFGAQFIVLFIPSKSQVYFPLVEQAFSRDAIMTAFRFYLAGSQRPIDLDGMRRNRLASNALMRRFCERAGIPLVDVTAALEARVVAGDNMYFPDDAHLNEAGQSIVADTLTAFMRGENLVARDDLATERKETEDVGSFNSSRPAGRFARSLQR